VVSTSAGLIGALANTAVGHIVLAPGTYSLSAELSVTRSVILEAAVSGTVVLNAQASSSSQRRVLLINPGSSGVVQLIRLTITGGYTVSVCALRSSKLPIRAPMGKMLTRLPRLSLAQLRPKSGQLQDVRAAETLKTSQCPNGKLTFCSLLAGRWCLCLVWHSGHLIVHHKWELC
jgi:hypothetical protein